MWCKADINLKTKGVLEKLLAPGRRAGWGYYFPVSPVGKYHCFITSLTQNFMTKFAILSESPARYFMEIVLEH